MKLTPDQLAMLEKCGATFMSLKEAAIVLQVKPFDLKKAVLDENSPAHEAYFKGKFTTEIELRESIITVAKRGSNPAQKMLLDLLQNMNLANL